MKRSTSKRSNLIALGALLVVAICTFVFFSRISISPRKPADRIDVTSTTRSLPAQLMDQAPGGSGSQPQLLTPQQAQADQRDYKQAPYKVKVGIYTVNNYGLDLSVPSYSGKGYIWFKWNQALQAYMDEAQIKIQDLMVPINLLGSADDDPFLPIGNSPELLDTGEYWQVFTYHGNFFIDQLSFHHYPFNQLALPLVIEADDPDGSLAYQGLRITPDLEQSGLGAYAAINGYNDLGFTMAEYRHHYSTNFGLGGAADDYSQLIYRVVYGSAVWSSFWTLLQPLAIVMAMVVVVSRIQHDIWDVRVGIPATVLLTLVFLQQSYKSGLPTLPYLTFLDEVYVVAFLLTLVAFVLSIWAGKKRFDLETIDDPEVVAWTKDRIERFDRIWPSAVIGVGFVAIVLCWII
jgi:hypothetical protein